MPYKAMIEPTAITTGLVSLGYSLTASNILGGISSVVIIIYFLSMLYYKIVKPYHNGKWGSYFKSIIKKFTK